MLNFLGVLLAHALRALLIIFVIALYVLIEIEKYREANRNEDLPKGLPEAR